MTSVNTDATTNRMPTTSTIAQQTLRRFLAECIRRSPYINPHTFSPNHCLCNDSRTTECVRIFSFDCPKKLAHNDRPLGTV